MTTDDASRDETVRAADEDDETDAEGGSSPADESSVDVDEEDESPTGTPEDTTPPAHDDEAENGNGDETVPNVELDLFDLSVRVSGQSTDDLNDVEETARSLMDYLVQQAHALEDAPDNRGLN